MCQQTILLSPLGLDAFYFSCLVVLAGTSIIMLDKSGKFGTLV